jgi:hypothetical protein
MPIAEKLAKLVPFEAYDQEIQKLMKLLRGLGIEIPENAKIRSDDLRAFEFLYYSLFADERPSSGQELARIQAGLGDIATKINKAWREPGSNVLRPHLAKMVMGGVRMNEISSVTDDAANKTCELYVGCLALCRGWRITLDDPDKSSGGLNPDVIMEHKGHPWSVAVKTIHGFPSQTIFQNIAGAVQQVEKSGKHGIPFINLKNRVNQSSLLSADRTFDSVEEANAQLRIAMSEIINRLRTEITDDDWREAFDAKLARPLVAFMGQSLVSARVTPAQDNRLSAPGVFFVPIRMIMVLPVPPLSMNPELAGLDKEAWDLLVELNDELQTTPCSASATGG